MKLVFVTGFPNNISTELQQALALETLTIDLLIKVTAEDTVATMQSIEGRVSFEMKLRIGITSKLSEEGKQLSRSGSVSPDNASDKQCLGSYQ